MKSRILKMSIPYTNIYQDTWTCINIFLNTVIIYKIINIKKAFNDWIGIEFNWVVYIESTVQWRADYQLIASEIGKNTLKLLQKQSYILPRIQFFHSRGLMVQLSETLY